MPALTERPVSASGIRTPRDGARELRSRCVPGGGGRCGVERARRGAALAPRGEGCARASHLAEPRARAVADADAPSAKTEPPRCGHPRAAREDRRARRDCLRVGDDVELFRARARRYDATAPRRRRRLWRSRSAADARHADALRGRFTGREALRPRVVHAARRTWAEKIGLIEARGDAFEREAEGGGGRAARRRRDRTPRSRRRKLDGEALQEPHRRRREGASVAGARCARSSRRRRRRGAAPRSTPPGGCRTRIDARPTPNQIEIEIEIRAALRSAARRRYDPSGSSGTSNLNLNLNLNLPRRRALPRTEATGATVRLARDGYRI